jgi:hypothetical protein
MRRNKAADFSAVRRTAGIQRRRASDLQNLIILLLILIVVLTSGCATYIKSRANDLADCFTVRGGFGVGLGVRAQVTNYLGASVGASREGKRVGYFGRTSVQCRCLWFGPPVPQIFSPIQLVSGITDRYSWESGECFGRAAIFLPCTNFATSEGPSFLPDGFNLLAINLKEFLPEFLGPKRVSPPTPFLREKFFIEFGAALFWVNFDVGFNPVEFVDFLLGWTTLDITGDD